MDLTIKESKLLEKMRQQERMWQTTRWVLLVIAVIMLAGWTWVTLLLFKFDAQGDKQLSGFVTAMAYPKVVFGFAMAGLFLGYAAKDWQGSPTRVFILKLMDAHTSADHDEQPQR